jgi:hypothetical protein
MQLRYADKQQKGLSKHLISGCSIGLTLLLSQVPLTMVPLEVWARVKEDVGKGKEE